MDDFESGMLGLGERLKSVGEMLSIFRCEVVATALLVSLADEDDGAVRFLGEDEFH